MIAREIKLRRASSILGSLRACVSRNKHSRVDMTDIDSPVQFTGELTQMKPLAKKYHYLANITKNQGFRDVCPYGSYQVSFKEGNLRLAAKLQIQILSATDYLLGFCFTNNKLRI